MNEPRVIESVTNECQLLGRAHESSSARAEQLIACLEGEIAKRDETIARLEPQLNRSIQANYDLRAELEAIKAQEPVGEVVGWYRLDRPYEMTSYPSVCAAWHKLGAPVAPLYAANVQQVSVIVPTHKMILAGEEQWERSGNEAPDVSAIFLAMIAAATAAPAADAGLTDAITGVLAERKRQINAEGWTPRHDDEHGDGSMALAASCYACASAGLDDAKRDWPWSDEWFKPSTPRRDLIKAGALILAEIERIDRASRAKDAE